MSWFSLVIGQKGSHQLATSSENLVPVLNFWSHWRLVSRNFEPYKLSCNTPTKQHHLPPLIVWGINPTNSVFIPQSLLLRSIVWG